MPLERINVNGWSPTHSQRLGLEPRGERATGIASTMQLMLEFPASKSQAHVYKFGYRGGSEPYHTKLLTNHSVPKGDVTGGYVRAVVDALRPSQEAIVISSADTGCR